MAKHFDKEIEHAIDFGCSTFVAGMNYPEDELFKERVNKIAKQYEDDTINFISVNLPKDNGECLKSFFILLADWEIYSYET